MPHFIRTRLFEKAPFFVLIDRTTGGAKLKKASNIKGFRIKDNSVRLEGRPSRSSVLQEIISYFKEYSKTQKPQRFLGFLFSLKYGFGANLLKQHLAILQSTLKFAIINTGNSLINLNLTNRYEPHIDHGGEIMTRGEVKYYLKVIRKGYKNISAFYGLANFVMIVLVGLFAFLLLVYEPASEWHNANVTLSHFEYRYSRGGAVLYLYTTDNRRYVLNHDEEEIRHQLKQGRQYIIVYSDDFFHDIIRGLEDSECEYINAEEMRRSHETERFWFSTILILCSFLLLLINSIYTISCIKEEKRRIQRRLRK